MFNWIDIQCFYSLATFKLLCKLRRTPIERCSRLPTAMVIHTLSASVFVLHGCW